MATPGATPTTAYTVIQFSLETGTNGQPTQRSSNCGSFSSVEEAFAHARTNAAQAWSRLVTVSASHIERPSLVDTEWGYDLRLGPLTVERFWVHDHRPTGTL